MGVTLPVGVGTGTQGCSEVSVDPAAADSRCITVSTRDVALAAWLRGDAQGPCTTVVCPLVDWRRPCGPGYIGI
jgi:hypothetical protein